MPEKTFRRQAWEIEKIVPDMGSCMASDRITVDGLQVGFMYRESPMDEIDTGWRLFSGDESDIYLKSSDNFEIYDINTVVNYYRDILDKLNCPIGSAFERNADTGQFEEVRFIAPEEI